MRMRLRPRYVMRRRFRRKTHPASLETSTSSKDRERVIRLREQLLEFPWLRLLRALRLRLLAASLRRLHRARRLVATAAAGVRSRAAAPHAGRQRLLLPPAGRLMPRVLPLAAVAEAGVLTRAS